MGLKLFSHNSLHVEIKSRRHIKNLETFFNNFPCQSWIHYWLNVKKKVNKRIATPFTQKRVKIIPKRVWFSPKEWKSITLQSLFTPTQNFLTPIQLFQELEFYSVTQESENPFTQKKMKIIPRKWNFTKKKRVRFTQNEWNFTQKRVKITFLLLLKKLVPN